MRTRLAILLALVLAFPVALALPAFAADNPILAQEAPGAEDPAGDADPADQDDESQGGEVNSEEGDGQSDADAETGASEDEQTEPAEVEAGPVWTYQMSKIVIVLFVLMMVGIAMAYRKLVVQRQRAGI